jgi:hypothetical protein
MKNLAVLLIALLAFSVSAISQGSPDLFWDNTLSGQGGRQNGRCRLAVAPAGAQAMLLIEDVPEPLNVNFPWKRKFTAITPAGLFVHSPVNPATTNYGLISKTGQMVVYHEHEATSPTMQDRVMLSTDYGQTFSVVPLPTSPTYTVYGDLGSDAFGSANRSYYNSVIGQDDKLYIFYFTSPANIPSAAIRYELNLLVVDINGVSTHTVISRLAAASLGSSIASFINVTSTNTEVIAVVRPGQLVTPRGGTTNYFNIPMAVVVDNATQSIQKISYGGTLGVPQQTRIPYESGLGATNNSSSSNLRMISTDGENLFMINGSTNLPSGRNPYRLREFPKNLNSYAGFFTNTEQNVPGYLPSWQPYMDLQSSAMDYGTYDTGFVGTGLGGLGNPSGGVTIDFTSKWGVGGVSDHSAEFYFLSASEYANGQDTVRRVRIAHPNTPPQSFVSELVEDCPVWLLQSVFGPPQGNYHIPYVYGERSHCSIEGAVISTFSYAIYVPPLHFYFHASDIS